MEVIFRSPSDNENSSNREHISSRLEAQSRDLSIVSPPSGDLPMASAQSRDLAIQTAASPDSSLETRQQSVSMPVSSERENIVNDLTNDRLSDDNAAIADDRDAAATIVVERDDIGTVIVERTEDVHVQSDTFSTELSQILPLVDSNSVVENAAQYGGEDILIDRPTESQDGTETIV